MRTLASIIVVVALTAVTANAIPVTDPAQGALQMTLVVDSSGNASLVNTSAAPLDVDGNEIWSAAAGLSPAGWESIADAVINRPLEVIAELGAGALSFGELTATTNLLAEGNMSAAATFQVNAPWTIGQPVVPPVDLNDLTYWYSKPTAPGDKFLGNVVPEPATAALLAIGGVALLLRRKRRF